MLDVRGRASSPRSRIAGPAAADIDRKRLGDLAPQRV
jgi:hypothetical protein